jgi:molybdenum cofactor cytidylyltransferase
MSWKKPTAGIILAAGLSQRFKGTKLLAKFKGKYLLEWVLDDALDSKLDRVILVLGHDAESIRAALKHKIDNPRLQVVVHPHFGEGLSRSLCAGLAAVQASHPSVMFLLGDQPMVGTATLNLLLSRFWRSPKDICVPVCRGRRGNPVLFSRNFYARVLSLTGDIGARHLILEYPEQVLTVEIHDPLCFIDIDTRAELKRLATA